MAAKSPSLKPAWKSAIRSAADPHRVKHALDILLPLASSLKNASAEQARILAALFSGSESATALLASKPEWLASLTVDLLQHPRRAQGLSRELHDVLKASSPRNVTEAAARIRRIREFKQREMLRIAARDLARLGDTQTILRQVSGVADVCLSAIFDLCWAELVREVGAPHHQDAEGRWRPTKFAVIGLGKLGGHELNYSSDVDVIFVYDDEGFVYPPAPNRNRNRNPDRGIPNHQFFRRLAERFVAEVSEPAEEGLLYRVDLRLRPEGDAGPWARSLESYENYYAQWGQTWERMMLIKARGVAGDAALAAEFLEMIQPFRYPRSLSESVLREIAAMKDRIEKEIVRTGEMDRNVKLGTGGIREIEFIVQTHQLLKAGRTPFLQGGSTLPVLEKLVQYGIVSAADAKALRTAYCFLRDVEHRLQMEHNLQTHTIPKESKGRERLARLMGLKIVAQFDATLKGHTRFVRGIYDRLLKTDAPEVGAALPREFRGAEEKWKTILAEHGFRDPEKAVRLLDEFANGPGYVHVSPRTAELAWELIPKLLVLCPTAERLAANSPSARVLSDPDRVLTRLDTFIAAYGTRAMLFEMWAHNPSLFELLLLLFDRSEFLAEIAIRTPDMVDELVLSGRLRRRKSAEEILDDLRHGRRDEDQRLWLRRYHQAELMRIGLRDILGLADHEQNFLELTALADACLQYALQVALKKKKTPPMVIIGLGKLGGRELNYGSDLDIIFVARPGAKDLQKLQRLAIDVMDLLSSPTELGVAFATDARLRPDGEKGLLVNTLDAYEEYYRRRAQLWEIQTLTRTRPIAGDLKLGERFQHLAAQLTNFARLTPAPNRNPNPNPAAFRPDWKTQIARMRLRIEKERTPAGQDALAIKTGSGGLIDAEFIAQALCLEHGWQEPNTVRVLERARDTKAIDPAQAASLIENYGKLRRVEAILRRWSYEGETVLPADPAPFYRVSVRCGFPTPEAFRQSVLGYRKAIREVYVKVLPQG
jgi:[glutamine synthetase] adenylyltransferase / [glutamine synthetase]-adenylyl-L-tyrosine phosphorylase